MILKCVRFAKLFATVVLHAPFILQLVTALKTVPYFDVSVVDYKAK